MSIRLHTADVCVGTSGRILGLAAKVTTPVEPHLTAEMIVTAQGKNRLAQATQNNTCLTISHIALGDHVGVISADNTRLSHERTRRAVYSTYLDKHDSDGDGVGTCYLTTIEDSNIGYNVWEIGLYLSDGTLFAVARKESEQDSPFVVKRRNVRLPLTFTVLLPMTTVMRLRTQMATLLPPSASQFDRMVEQTLARVGNLRPGIREMWNPDTCPPALLPWLAWAMSVDEWNPAADAVDALKRRLIKSSVDVHRRKGTREAMRSALDAFGMDIAIKEWFDTTNAPASKAPYTFEIQVRIKDGVNVDGGALIDAGFYQQVTQVVDQVKPVRSRYALSVAAVFSQVKRIGAISLNQITVVRREVKCAAIDETRPQLHMRVGAVIPEPLTVWRNDIRLRGGTT